MGKKGALLTKWLSVPGTVLCLPSMLLLHYFHASVTEVSGQPP